MAGNNMYYNTNSITMGGGESMDVILDATNVPAGTYFLYSPIWIISRMTRRTSAE